MLLSAEYVGAVSSSILTSFSMVFKSVIFSVTILSLILSC